ncbi:MAG: hypothetical protein R3A48_07500 [Polyangiales bacterium]
MDRTPSAQRWLLAVSFGVGCTRTPPRRAPADVVVTSVISAADARAPGCPALERRRGGGTLHAGEILGAERWRAEDSPHLLPYGMVVRRGARLELEPCALLLVGASRSVTVATGGALVARGEAPRPIAFSPLEARPWAGLELEAGVDPTSALTAVEIVGAGAGASERPSAALAVAAEGLVAQGVRVAASESWGVWMRRGASFAAGASLDVEGAGEGVAVVDDVNDAARLPLRTLRRNARDEVLVAGGVATLRRDAVWGALGLRYAVRDGVRLRVGGPASPQLTILPGTTVIFGADSALDVGVGEPGALRIDAGDAGAMTTLRGVGDGAATWLGVTLGAQIDLSRSAFRGVIVASAGAPTGSPRAGCGCSTDARADAAMLALAPAGAAQIVSNVLLQRGFARGVGVAWVGDSAPRGATLVASGGVDVRGAGVMCAELAPAPPTGCGGE